MNLFNVLGNIGNIIAFIKSVEELIRKISDGKATKLDYETVVLGIVKLFENKVFKIGNFTDDEIKKIGQSIRDGLKEIA